MGYSDINQNPVTPGDIVPVTADLNATGVGAASQFVLGLNAPSPKNLVYIQGFIIGGLGATAASLVNATLTGVTGGPLNIPIPVPAGVGTIVPPVVFFFTRPLKCTTIGGNIALTVPSFGAGNVAASGSAFGFFI